MTALTIQQRLILHQLNKRLAEELASEIVILSKLNQAINKLNQEYVKQLYDLTAQWRDKYDVLVLEHFERLRKYPNGFKFMQDGHELEVVGFSVNGQPSLDDKRGINQGKYHVHVSYSCQYTDHPYGSRPVISEWEIDGWVALETAE